MYYIGLGVSDQLHNSLPIALAIHLYNKYVITSAFIQTFSIPYKYTRKAKRVFYKTISWINIRTLLCNLCGDQLGRRSAKYLSNVLLVNHAMHLKHHLFQPDDLLSIAVVVR